MKYKAPVFIIFTLITLVFLSVFNKTKLDEEKIEPKKDKDSFNVSESSAQNKSQPILPASDLACCDQENQTHSSVPQAENPYEKYGFKNFGELKEVALDFRRMCVRKFLINLGNLLLRLIISSPSMLTKMAISFSFVKCHFELNN
jgi:hypothetical protein